MRNDPKEPAGLCEAVRPKPENPDDDLKILRLYYLIKASNRLTLHLIISEASPQTDESMRNISPNEDLVQQADGKGDTWIEAAETQMLFGRLLRPYDIAFLTTFLLNDQAEMMTGALIDCNQNVIGAWD